MKAILLFSKNRGAQKNEALRFFLLGDTTSYF